VDELINVVLWSAASLVVAQRAAGRSRYQALKEEDANAERYAAWRGGVRGAGETTGASVAMQILQRQARIGAGIAVAGLVLVLLGFLIK
jgi:hypothetical protein